MNGSLRLARKRTRDGMMRAWIGFSLALAAMTCDATAADWYTGVPTDGPAKKAMPGVAIDVAVDGTSQRALSGALIGTIAPFASLDESGMRLRLNGLGGAYTYVASSAILGRIHGVQEQGGFLAGYEWVAPQAKVAGYAGAEVTHNSLSPVDPNNSVKGTRGGFKLGAEFYVTPTEQTMLSGVGAYSTNHNAYYGRFKFGMAVADHVYMGPEALALGDDYFQQFRVGSHLSGVKFGAAQFGVSGGFVHDRVRGGGAYGILDTRVTF
jgi:hypothetical protein